MDIRRVNNPDGSVTLTDTDYPGQRIDIAPNGRTIATLPEDGQSLYPSDVGQRTLAELDGFHNAVVTGSVITYPDTNLHEDTWVGGQSFPPPPPTPGSKPPYLNPSDLPPQEELQHRAQPQRHR